MNNFEKNNENTDVGNDFLKLKILETSLESVKMIQAAYDLFDYSAFQNCSVLIHDHLVERVNVGHSAKLSSFNNEIERKKCFDELLFQEKLIFKKKLSDKIKNKRIESEVPADNFLKSFTGIDFQILSNICKSYEKVVGQIENDQLLSGNRFSINKYTPAENELQSLVLEIGQTAGDSQFSTGKQKKIELVGGKYFEYENGAPSNKDEIIAGLKNPETFKSVILQEFSEESKIPEEYVKKMKYLGTHERPIEGVYKKDPNVKLKCDDLFSVEVVSYAEVQLNNEGSDDNHSAYAWVPMQEMKDMVTSQTSIEALSVLPKNEFPIVWESLFGDVSDITRRKISRLFDSLNSHKKFFDSFRRGGNKKIEKSEKIIDSFIDLGRIDQMRLSDLKKLFFQSFEVDENNLAEDLEQKLAPSLNVALDYEIKHRKREYSSEFIAFMKKNEMKTLKDVHNFIRGYSRHPDYKPEWKNWVLDHFKVAFCHKYLKDSIPNIEKLDEYQKEYDTAVRGTLDGMGLKEKNPKNKSEPYDYIYTSNPKALFRLLDKLLTKHELTIEEINDAVRGRIIFVDKEVRKKFVKNFQKKFTSVWKLKWEPGKKERGRENEFKAEGKMLTNDGVRIPAELQTLLEHDYMQTESYDKHHDVYEFLKGFHNLDRAREISEDEMVAAIKKAISNPDVTKDRSRKEVEDGISKQVRDQFFRMPSANDPSKFAYYSKKNLKNIIGQSQRADEETMLGNMVIYLAELDNLQSEESVDSKKVDPETDFDKDFRIFFNKIEPALNQKKLNALKFLRDSKTTDATKIKEGIA